MLIFIFLFCFLIRYMGFIQCNWSFDRNRYMDSWNLFSKIDYLIGIDVWIRVTFNINVTTNFSIYLLHLSFSPQKKKVSNLFRLLENSFTDTSFWDSDIFNSDDAGALARSRSYLDLDRYLCGSFNDVDVLWNAARWKHNSGKGKNGKKSFWQRCVHRGFLYFVRHVMRIRTWMGTRYCGQLLP